MFTIISLTAPFTTFFIILISIFLYVPCTYGTTTINNIYVTNKVAIIITNIVFTKRNLYSMDTYRQFKLIHIAVHF